MDGIYIVNTYICRNIAISLVVTNIIFWSIFLFVLGMLIEELLRIREKSFGQRFIVVALCICGLFSAFVFMSWIKNEVQECRTFHEEYDILIDDSVSYNDFVKKYEVLQTNGNLYRVKEKNEE